MLELNLKYETSQQTNIEPSVLIDKIFIYLKKDYKISAKTNRKIVFAFNNASGMLWMSGANRFKIIQNGTFEICDERITLTYYIDISFHILFITTALLLTVFTDKSALIISILPIIELISKIRTLKKSSLIMVKYITANTAQPIITQLKSIDREKN